jgi:hypothetical protein
VSDRYQIYIPESLHSAMSAWDIPTDVRRLMEDRLRSTLASDPTACLKRCFAPWNERLNLYAFNLPDTVSEHIQHIFMFDFVYGEDEKSLHMVHCGYQKKNDRPDQNASQTGPIVE